MWSRFENVHAFDQLKFRECIGGFDCLPTDDPYDCESVMHYSTDHFSYNGENTIGEKRSDNDNSKRSLFHLFLPSRGS